MKVFSSISLKVLMTAFFLFNTVAGNSDEQNCFIINTFVRPPLSTPDSQGLVDLIVKEAFERLGYQIIIRHRPVERSIREANRCDADGEFMRIEGIERLYPNLILVNEHLFNFEFVTFTTLPVLKIEGWTSLFNTRVGIVIGWKIVEEQLAGVKLRYDVPDPISLFKMLEAGRIDAAVYARLQGSYILEQLEISGIRIIEPPLAVKPMFLYMNKKYLKLIPELERVLREMKSDGSIDAIAGQLFGSEEH